MIVAADVVEIVEAVVAVRDHKRLSERSLRAVQLVEAAVGEEINATIVTPTCGLTSSMPVPPARTLTTILRSLKTWKSQRSPRHSSRSHQRRP